MTSRDNDIPLGRIPRRPDSLHPSAKYLDERPEPSPLSANSCESADIEDYIGSGTDTVGGRTPVILRRLSFGHEVSSDEDTDEHHGRLRTPRHFEVDDEEEEEEEDEDDDGMDPTRPSYLRANDGKSGTPLLFKPDEERGRPRYNSSRNASPLLTPTSSTGMRTPHHFSRRRTMRSRSPDTAARIAARKKYSYAAFFLVVTLVSFCVQTELAAYVQTELGWNKAYCMLYLTHGSWATLWPVQLLILRLQKWNMPWNTFWRRHVYLLRSTAQMVRAQDLDIPRHMSRESPVPYLLRTTAFVTSALTVAGLSWYIAVDMTSPSDLTAIYNCSAFFAYAFSVPLLREKLRLDKSLAVLIAIAGVLVVAYGDSKPTTGGEDEAKQQLAAGTRFLGNMIIGAGSILYGLYEVLYKKLACPPEGVSANRGMIFANAFGSCIGLFTLTVLWVPLPILHIIGWEKFELPTGETALWLWISVVMNASFAGSFLVLISLTSPVLSSVAALLTIFLVAIVDWLRTGEAMSAAAIIGGIMIIVAFVMLSWSTWREMTEESEREAGVAGLAYEESSSDDDDNDDGRKSRNDDRLD